MDKKSIKNELFFILIFIICLIIAISGINKMGIFGNVEYFGDNTTNYEELEENLIDGAKLYAEKEINNITEETVSLNYLVNNLYMNELKDKKGNKCSGYVEIKKSESGNVVYFPYLKCKSYKTHGYEDVKDEK